MNLDHSDVIEKARQELFNLSSLLTTMSSTVEVDNSITLDSTCLRHTLRYLSDRVWSAHEKLDGILEGDRLQEREVQQFRSAS